LRLGHGWWPRHRSNARPTDATPAHPAHRRGPETVFHGIDFSTVEGIDGERGHLEVFIRFKDGSTTVLDSYPGEDLYMRCRTELSISMSHKETEMEKEAIMEFLDTLRESGVTNMFGAGPYVQEEFGLDKKEAGAMVGEWMRTFGDRHPQ
jgi:hypothetical protein